MSSPFLDFGEPFYERPDPREEDYLEHVEAREQERLDRRRDYAGSVFLCDPCECGGASECHRCNPEGGAS
jgi:hypothetical protein